MSSSDDLSKKLNKMINSVDINKKKPKTFLLPYESASGLEIPIPIIIKIIPPALNNPKPADIGSFQKKLTPTLDKKFKIGLIKSVRRALST